MLYQASCPFPNTHLQPLMWEICGFYFCYLLGLFVLGAAFETQIQAFAVPSLR